MECCPFPPQARLRRALAPCHRAVARLYEVSFFALCRTLRQALCTGRMGLRALDAFEGPGVEVAKARGEEPAVGMWNERSHSLTHPASPPDSPSPSRLTRPASCPSPRHPAGSEAGRFWHLPSPIRAVRARAINYHPVSITQTLYMDRANTRLPTNRDHGSRRAAAAGGQTARQRERMVGRSRRPLDRHMRTCTSGDLTAAATSPSSETMHICPGTTLICPAYPHCPKPGDSVVAGQSNSAGLYCLTKNDRKPSVEVPGVLGSCESRRLVYLASHIRPGSRKGDRGRETDEISVVTQDR